jgi:histidinol-phosphate aminotransferase
MSLRADLTRVAAYAPEQLNGVSLDLRDNINLWGAPPAATAALRSAESSLVTAYPSVGARGLVETLAAQIGVAPENIVAGCGSDDVIDACLRAVGAAGARVAHADPSFAMVPTFARLNRLEPVGVPLLASGAMDVDGLLATNAALIYVCSPNNPTGTVTSREELLRLFDAAPGIVLLDEAYAEFCDAPDLRAEAARRENVLVTRTFSKAWGLAGLRVGYGVGGAALVRAVTAARGPYKVNALAERAAVAALNNDTAWMTTSANAAREVRDRFARTLQDRAGVRVFDSQANFVFVSVQSSREVAARFQAQGVGVRAFSGLTGIGDAVRIGVAPWSRMERVERIATEVWP